LRDFVCFDLGHKKLSAVSHQLKLFARLSFFSPSGPAISFADVPDG
jgi:hypothetical protein